MPKNMPCHLKVINCDVCEKYYHIKCSINFRTKTFYAEPGFALGIHLIPYPIPISLIINCIWKLIMFLYRHLKLQSPCPALLYSPYLIKCLDETLKQMNL